MMHHHRGVGALLLLESFRIGELVDLVRAEGEGGSSSHLLVFQHDVARLANELKSWWETLPQAPAD
ncbi:MAG: hypothetical protein VXW27_10280, partial [Pseudomonadota bacterium]|nr:hypothetical protein [Pseudomonadota bacterium]